MDRERKREKDHSGFGGCLIFSPRACVRAHVIERQWLCEWRRACVRAKERKSVALRLHSLFLQMRERDREPPKCGQKGEYAEKEAPLDPLTHGHEKERSRTDEEN